MCFYSLLSGSGCPIYYCASSWDIVSIINIYTLQISHHPTARATPSLSATSALTSTTPLSCPTTTPHCLTLRPRKTKWEAGSPPCPRSNTPLPSLPLYPPTYSSPSTTQKAHSFPFSRFIFYYLFEKLPPWVRKCSSFRLIETRCGGCCCYVGLSLCYEELVFAVQFLVAP